MMSMSMIQALVSRLIRGGQYCRNLCCTHYELESFFFAVLIGRGKIGPDEPKTSDMLVQKCC